MPLDWLTIGILLLLIPEVLLAIALDTRRRVALGKAVREYCTKEDLGRIHAIEKLTREAKQSDWYRQNRSLFRDYRLLKTSKHNAIIVAYKPIGFRLRLENFTHHICEVTNGSINNTEGEQ